jgi:hypothetical protein
MGQPGEGHGFDPVRIDAVAAVLARAPGSSWPGGHQRAVARAAAADQQCFGALLGALQRVDDAACSQLQQCGLHVLVA